MFIFFSFLEYFGIRAHSAILVYFLLPLALGGGVSSSYAGGVEEEKKRIEENYTKSIEHYNDAIEQIKTARLKIISIRNIKINGFENGDLNSQQAQREEQIKLQELLLEKYSHKLPGLELDVAKKKRLLQGAQSSLIEQQKENIKKSELKLVQLLSCNPSN
jgi:hypothetical protein